MFFIFIETGCLGMCSVTTKMYILFKIFEKYINKYGKNLLPSLEGCRFATLFQKCKKKAK